MGTAPRRPDYGLINYALGSHFGQELVILLKLLIFVAELSKKWVPDVPLTSGDANPQLSTTVQNKQMRLQTDL